MSWYRCAGCGPSQQCDICGATECAQSLRDNADCPGCQKAITAAKTPPPWNMHVPRGVRPTKHNRKWLGKQRRRRAKWYKAQRRWEKSQGLTLEF